MSLAKLTMISFNSYLNQMYDGQTLFDLLTLPEGIDKEDLVDNIMLQGGEFEVLYSDPVFMREAVGSWGRKCYNTFLRWITAQNIQYNPLENYDRNESITDQYYKAVSSSARRDSGNTRTFNNQDKRTLDTEEKRTLDTEDKRTLDTEDKRTLDTEDKRTLDTEDERTLDTTRTSEDEVSAFDSSTYQPSAKNTTDDDGTDTTTHTGTDTIERSGTDTLTNTGTDTLDHTGTDTLDHTGTDTVDYSGTIKDEYGEGSSGNENENSTNTHSSRIHGNIGVTTSQQMLQQEYDIARFNIIDQITDMFILEFCIPIYE